MEMISFEMLVYVVVAVVASIIGVVGYNRLHRWLRHRNAVEARLRDLAEHSSRQELTDALKKWRIVGDADIREGIVMAPVPADKLEPLAIVLGNAAAFIARLRNPAASSLYVRDSVNDRFILLADLDLDHLVDAARVMQRVAEDRRKSRSIYKGLTEEEMQRFVRAGLSSWLKDDGEFGHANEVMQGLWDKRPEFLMAMEVLDLVFKVKGARND